MKTQQEVVIKDLLDVTVFCICPICAAALFEFSAPLGTDDDLLLMTPDPDPTPSHAMTPLPIPPPQGRPEAALPPAVQADASWGQNTESFFTVPLPDKGINSEPASSPALRPVLTSNL